MPNIPHRATLAGVLALPLIVGAGFLGWRVPQSSDRGHGVAPPTAPAGSLPVGGTSYKVPKGALFVSPSGDDGAQGTREHPLRSLGRAVARAGSGSTVVLRGGVYHESVDVPRGKRLTIQSFPREAVWFDGSSLVTGWRADGSAWARDGWTTRFDSSPTYTKGARPSDKADFRFVSPEHPMAAHPDQLWVDGVRQEQVASRGQVKPGTFFVDEGASRLYMGSDPRGRNVRASTLGIAVTIDSEGSTLRGIGFRRYGTALPDIGMVRVTAPRITVENVTTTESATTGLTVVAAHARVRRLTSSRNGLLGVHANTADDLRLESVLLDHNNRERFKYSPVSGGFKITRSRTVAVVGSTIVDNLGKGLWIDESVRDITITGDRILRNAHHGVSLELSARALVAGNVISGNAGDGLKVNNTSDVRIWNNSMSGNGRTLGLDQDPRRPDDPSVPGRDPRQKTPDPAMTWRVEKISISNNTFADARPGTPCLLCVADHTGKRDAGRMGITVNGNLYVRQSASNPRTLIMWSNRPFGDLDRFRSATGQEARGAARDGGTAASPEGALDPAIAARANTATALPLPADIAKLLGRPAGTRHMGAFF
ncbi:right-handed parallel beta-helix repeat-containing protein [Actinomadura litoris]|uniref:right-handed parallel beta-helix repeat-containing protein n=1 Tax=Actinomadura litoris TaxID=2678616 RepID=UPI001FA6D3A7|nr:right-handed parallel beta-helix repeat-containing protein [Actinomadura litoris]